ncbi:hypothetical protein F4861DRAFT_497907 [Xylaria intraflava]|nr:hypothetical protein F4861DRAFT_497907 [Xylaria intraflava]
MARRGEASKPLTLLNSFFLFLFFSLCFSGGERGGAFGISDDHVATLFFPASVSWGVPGAIAYLGEGLGSLGGYCFAYDR